MTRRAFLLLPLLLLSPAGCATKAQPLAPYTAHHVDKPITFLSNGKRFEAPAGSAIVDGSFPDYLKNILRRMFHAEMRAEMAERQLQLMIEKEREDNDV